ncbi:MAG TPA: BON domain-containing protein [Bryobacteraceae bacterium]|nr:BON domain-containing protein [Bryobacteraceae bacterium]
MKRYMRYFLSLLVLFCLVSTMWAEKPVSDDEIYNNVKIRLAGDRDVKGGGIDVTVQSGVVTLKGTVETDNAKSKAEKLTKKVKGVKQVINQLQVAPK